MVTLSLQSGSALLCRVFYAASPTQCSPTPLLYVGECLCFPPSGSLFVCAWAGLFRSEQSFLPMRAPMATTVQSDKSQHRYRGETSTPPFPTHHPALVYFTSEEMQHGLGTL